VCFSWRFDDYFEHPFTSCDFLGNEYQNKLLRLSLMCVNAAASASVTSGGSGTQSSPNAEVTMCCTCDLAALPLPVTHFFMRVAE